MTAYKMAIVFALDISLKELNHITEQIDGGRLVLNNAKEVIIEQTVGFVPSELHLKQYANAIQDAMNKDSRIHVENVRFVRYDYLTPIDIPEPPTPHENLNADTCESLDNPPTEYIQFQITCINQQNNESRKVTIYMATDPKNAIDWEHINPASGKQQLITRIQNYLKSRAGWAAIQNSPDTFCWNNIATILPIAEQGLYASLPDNSVKRFTIRLTVNQNERLTPDIAFGTLVLSTAAGDKTSIHGMLDMQTGDIQTEEDFSAKDFICATFYPFGSSSGFICNSSKNYLAIYKA